MHWPALVPGVFAAHEMFHFFVITGTTCHVVFMLGVVIPSPEPAALAVRAGSRMAQGELRIAGRPIVARSDFPIFRGEHGQTIFAPLALRSGLATSSPPYQPTTPSKLLDRADPSLPKRPRLTDSS